MSIHFLARGLVVIAAASLCAACANTGETTPPAERRAKPEYLTGSHIPVKESAQPVTDAEREKTVERFRELQKTSQPVVTKP